MRVTDDLIADKIYTENFRLVLNYTMDKIIDLVETSHRGSDTLSHSSEDVVQLDNQLLIEFKTPVESKSLRLLNPLPQTVHLRFTSQ